MGNNPNSTTGSSILLSKLSAIRNQLFLAKRDIFELESLYLYLAMGSPNSKIMGSDSPSLAFFYDINKIQERLSDTLDTRNFLEMDESTFLSIIKSIYAQTGPMGAEIVNLARIHNYVPIS